MGLILFGIMINISFAWFIASQLYTSIHSLLSLLALAFLPQDTLSLVLGTLVAASAISFSFRHRWDRHLITVLFSFFVFILYQKLFVDIYSDAYMLVGKFSVIAIGLEAALVHYRKDYQSDRFRSLPVLVHLLNWLLIASGLLLFYTGSSWECIPVGLGSIALYFLSKKGKQLGVRWVYVCDMLIAEIFALVAIVMLSRLQLDPFFIAGLAFLETQAFFILMRKEGDSYLDIVSRFLIPSAGLVLAIIAFKRLSLESHILQDILILLALAISTYILAIKKSYRKIPWHFCQGTLVSQVLIAILLISLHRWGVSKLVWSGLIFIEFILFVFLNRWHQDNRSIRISKHLMHLSGTYWFFVALHAAYSFGQTKAIEFITAVLGVTIFIFFAGRWIIKREGEKFEGINLYSKRSTLNLSILWLIIGMVPLIMSRYCLLNPGFFWLWELVVCVILVAFIWVRSSLQINGLGAGILISMIFVAVFSLVSLKQNELLGTWKLVTKTIPVLLVFSTSIYLSFIKDINRHVTWIGVYLLSIYAAFATGIIFYPQSEILPSVIWIILSLIFLESALRLAPTETRPRGNVSFHLLISGLGFIVLFLISHLLVNLQVEAYALGIKVRALVAIFGLVAISYWFFARWPEDTRRIAFFDNLQPFFLEILLALSILTIAMEASSVTQPLIWMLLAGVFLLVGRKFARRFSRLAFYSLLLAWTALIHTVITVSTLNAIATTWYTSPWVIGSFVLLLHGLYLGILIRKPVLEDTEFPRGLTKLGKIINIILKRKNLWLFYPFFIGTALFLYWRFDKTLLTVLWVAEVFFIFTLSVWLRENHYRILSLSALAACLIRLVFFDLVGTPVLTRGLVFVAIGGIMLLMNAMYVRFGERFNAKQ